MTAAAALLFLAGTSSAQVLQLYYPLEDNVAPGGAIQNFGALATPGTLVGGGAFVPGAAPSFSGGLALHIANNDAHYIDTALGAGPLGFNSGNPDGYASMAWVNMTAEAGDSMVFGQGPGGGNYLHNGIRNTSYHVGHWGNDLTAGSVTFDAANGPGNWHHVIWEYAQGVERIYVDGTNVGEGARGTLANTDPIRIGGTDTGRAFNGYLDDVAVYTLSGGERLFPNQVNHLSGGGDPTALPAADPESLPAAPDFIPVGLGAGAAGFAQMQITYTSGILPDINNVSQAIAALESGAAPLISENVSMANHADTGPGGSAGGGYSITRVPKARYPGDVDGDTNDFSYVYNGYVDIPADGVYTFGVDGDDGQRMKLAGASFEIIGGNGTGGTTTYRPSASDVFGFEGNTGDAFTLAKTFLTAGSHQIQVVGYERGGGAFNEVFAAVGETTDVANDFRGIGHQAGDDAVMLGVSDNGWSVLTTAPGGAALNTLAEAVAEVQATIDAGGVPVTHPSINFNDPGFGGPGRIGGDVPFDGEVAGTDDEDFATLATATLVVPVDGTYRIGFQGDDGGEFGFFDPSVSFSALVENATGVSVIGPGVFGAPGGSQAITCDCLTGNSSTVGEVTLLAGDYEVYAGFWERGGGAYWEVFGSGPNSGLKLISAGGSMIVPDFDGLQWANVPEPSSFALAGIGMVGLLVTLRRRRRG